MAANQCAVKPSSVGVENGERDPRERGPTYIYSGAPGAVTIGLDGQHRKQMDSRRSGSQPSGKGPAEWFSGTVRVDPLFQGGASRIEIQGARYPEQLEKRTGL